jgi:hypothetical protein
MPETKPYFNDYRQRLAGRIEQLVTPNFKKILVFGDKFEALENAWKKEGKKVTRLETLKEDWFDITRDKPEFDLPVDKQSFDLLIGYHSLEKALDPERLLLELRKYLVKEGALISITYNVGHISTVVNLLTEGWAHKNDGPLRTGNIRYFSYDSIKELFKLGGFEITSEDIYGIPELPELTNQLVKLTKNPYLNALSFIFKGKRIETFPFIEGTYP